jgi:hypothetical protein
MPNSNHINPTSTSSAYSPSTRGNIGNDHQLTLPVTAGAATSLPQIDPSLYPCLFAFTADGARTLKTANGIVMALNASNIHVVAAGTGFATSASTTADHVVISISSGVITMTNAGTNNATFPTTYKVTQLT